MDSYRTRQMLGSLPEHQIGFKSLRLRDLQSWAKEAGMNIAGIDNMPKYELVQGLDAAVLTGEIDPLA